MEAVSARKRMEERVTTARPVHLDQGTGITRNVSASGVFFETDVNYAAGSEISFSIELDGPGGKIMLRCQGQIVRVEQLDGKFGVAVKIIESRLEPVRGGAIQVAPRFCDTKAPLKIQNCKSSPKPI